MPVMTKKSQLLPGNVIHFPDATRGEFLDYLFAYDVHVVGGLARLMPGVAAGNQTVVPVRFAPNEYAPYSEGGQITLPIGAAVISTMFKVPADITATNGNRLKVGSAVDAAVTAGVALAAQTAVAADDTFAPESVIQTAPFGQFMGLSAANTVLVGALNMNLYITNGTTGAGSGVTVTQETLIPVTFVYATPKSVAPDVDKVYKYTRGRSKVMSS
jgi:hypothetical protein